MKFIAATIVTLMISANACLAQPGVEFQILGGRYFDTPSGTFLANPGIASVDGKLVIGPLPATHPAAQRVIELRDDQYILPGLVDCHAHYNVRLFKKRREEFEVMPVIYLANGATTTFSCGEFDPENMYRLRKRIESGDQIGPRLINSGPYFGRARPGWRGTRTQQEIFDEIDFWAEKGIGGIKVKAIGPDDLKYVIERAHHHKLTVTGHLDSGYRGSVNPRDAISMGIDRIEHFIGGDAMPDTRSAYDSLGSIRPDMPEYERAVAWFIEHKTVFDATLTAYGYFGSPFEEFDYWMDEREFFTPLVQQRVAERPAAKPNPVFEQIYLAKQKSISRFHELGGILTLGTDHVSDGHHLPGFGLHRELDAFVRNGIPPADAIRIGTINGAKALNIDNITGSLETGKQADLLVIDGNPLQQIRNTRNVQFVATQGRLYESNKLFESVKGKLGPVDEAGVGDW